VVEFPIELLPVDIDSLLDGLFGAHEHFVKPLFKARFSDHGQRCLFRVDEVGRDGRSLRLRPV